MNSAMTKTKYGICGVVGACFFCWIAPVISADNSVYSVSAYQEALIVEEVKHIVQTYYRYFSAGEMEKLPNETHNIPYGVLGRDSYKFSAEETIESYKQSFASLQQNEPSYDHSVYTFTNVCVLTPRGAITSGYNTRRRRDGSVISVLGAVYILGLTDDGWRIVSFLSTSPDKIVDC